LWFGQFIHGVLEEAYRRYRRHRDNTGEEVIASGAELQEILELIARRLAANGLRPRNANLDSVGRERAIIAVTELGPELFPIINEAEIPLNGTRRLPFERWPHDLPHRESDRYEMAGVVDVITEVQLDDPSLANNRVIEAIVGVLPKPFPTQFEVVVDYKGMRRPSIRPGGTGPDYWSIYEWQLQTYAQLRTIRPGAPPVLAGVLVFVNELHPTWADLEALRREVDAGLTDVGPDRGSESESLLQTKRKRGAPPPTFSFDFRLRRALRVVPISRNSQDAASSHFDNVVFNIELSRARERRSPHILAEWPTNASDDATCVACDWRTICPEHPAVVPILPTEEA
jgi:hypothetical protein